MAMTSGGRGGVTGAAVVVILALSASTLAVGAGIVGLCLPNRTTNRTYDREIVYRSTARRRLIDIAAACPLGPLKLISTGARDKGMEQVRRTVAYTTFLRTKRARV